MDQLIAQVTQRTGISEEQARTAVQTVMTFLQDKLPAPIAAQVANVVNGQGLDDLAGQAQQALGGIGGMFKK